MKLRYILAILLILSITYIGYTFQPSSVPYIDNFIVEEVIEEPDYSLEIADFLESYKSYFEYKFHEYGSVGGALAIVYKGQVVVLKPYGVKKIHTTDSVDVNTVFRLASVSKGFAGVLSSILHHKKIIHLDTTVISYLPDLQLKKKENQQLLTVENLLSHTSGLVSYSFDPYIERGVSFSKIYSNLKIANISSKPGELYAYQNVMFSLVDTIIHKQTGKSYETVLKEMIFNPLGMIDASVTFDGFTSTQNYAYPHKGWKNHVAALPLNNRYYETKPAAGVNASITDMSKWLQALLGYAPEVIDSTVLADIQTPRIPIRSKYKYSGALWSGVDSKEYSLGWRVFNMHDTKVMYHGGFVEGYRAEIAFCPEKKIGIVVLLNSANTLAMEAIPTFLHSFFEYSPKVPQVISPLTAQNQTKGLKPHAF
jgi:beta-lactamase class C